MNRQQQVFTELTDNTDSGFLEEARPPKATRDYKSRLFIRYFHDKKRLLDLYNSMSGRHYEDPEQLEINTLGNAIYMSMYNDISFIIDEGLSLYEHQSTFNPNIALRFLFYLADLYSNYVREMNIYGSSLLYIPVPRFVVFYNGVEKRPEYEELKLSDMYLKREEKLNLELLVDVYNINPGYNQELVESCRPLYEYVVYTSRVRKYVAEKDAKGNKVRTIEEAVEKAITECIQEGILKDFLMQNRAEAKHMSIYEYDEEKHMRMEREEHFARGLAEGRLENFLNILRDLGEVPSEVLERAKSLDSECMKNWTRLAARADSLEEFLEKID